MHTSLDGFTAGPEGEMDWICVDNEMFDYALIRTNEADIALYGRVTYQLMDNYWPTAADKPNATKHDIEHSTWYNSVAKVIASRTMKGNNPANTRIISDNLITEIRKLTKECGKEIIMFGSPTIAHLLMNENLIDDYWLFVNPVILGKGRPLFKDLNHAINLKLVTSKTLPSGVVCLHYKAKSDE